MSFLSSSGYFDFIMIQITNNKSLFSGKETAVDLAKRGARVVMGCRCVKRGGVALEEVKQRSDNDNIHLEILDLSSLKSIR